MLETLYNFFHSKEILVVNAWLGIPITILVLVLILLKRNRDERGLKIIGKASITSFVYFIIIANVIAKMIGKFALHWDIDYLLVANVIQSLYNSLLLIEATLIVILKRLE